MILKGRTALVTGSGGTGCGRAIACRLAAEGSVVIVSDVNAAGGEETVRLIQAAGGHAVFFHADVREEMQVRNLIDFAANQGGALGVLVNNASAFLGHGYDMEHWLALAQ